MESLISNLDDLFNKAELYCAIKIKLFNKVNNGYLIQKEGLESIINLLGVKQNTITTQCKWCNKEYPFSIYAQLDKLSDSYPMASSSPIIRITKSLYIDYKDCQLNYDKSSVLNQNELFSEATVSYYQFTFTCTKHSNHKYIMYLMIKREMEYFTIIKIGQYPSMIDVWGFDFDNYKKQLERIAAYDDFKKAELCMADSFVAGAFTYLRRVFEKMLNEYCAGMSLPDNHVETKVKAAKKRFDPRIHEMLNNLYKILSKGIHELNDEEASDYYQYLRAVIVMQLEHVKEQNDKDEQSKKLEKLINGIASKIK